MIDRQADEDFGVRDEVVDIEVGVEDRADMGAEGNAEDLETIGDIIDEHLRDLAEGVERLKGELAPFLEPKFADSAESVEEGEDTATEEDLVMRGDRGTAQQYTVNPNPLRLRGRTKDPGKRANRQSRWR